MKLLILALDGFDPHLFSAWRDQLPNLSGLAAQGHWRPAASTIPPMTFPAWSSFLTGANPGLHGIFDFTERLPDRLGVRFVNATRRRLPTFLRLACDAGLKVGSIGIPTTYPPETLSGYQISGFDTPLPSKADQSYIQPPELADRIERELGGYYFGDFNESRIGKDWHLETLQKLLDGLRRKAELARFLHKEYPVDLLVLHVGETDTVGHHFWSFHDRHSPRHVESRDPRLPAAVLDVYRAADQFAGEILEMTQPENVMVISDHGMGGTSDRVLYLNRYLESRGLLKFIPGASGSAWMGKLKTWGLHWTPYRLQQQVFKAAGGRIAAGIESLQRFGGIDWAGTIAYSEELNYFPAVWLNLEGREPDGIVKPDEASATLEQVRNALLEWRDPLDDIPVVQAVHCREEIYHGPEVPLAPDLILELNQPEGYSYALGRSTSAEGLSPWRRLRPEEYLGFKGASMNGSHRCRGIFILKTRDKAIVPPQDFSIMDAAPLALKMLGIAVPGWMERIMPGADDDDEVIPQASSQVPYSADQEEILRRRLAGLGYL